MPEHDRLKNIRKETLSNAWYTLYRYEFDYRRSDGRWETQQREVYDRGNGAAVLLYDSSRRKILLTRQFRMPTFVNQNPGGLLTEACAGLLTEACAGLLDGADLEAAIRKEILEETGYRVERLEKILEAYSSPGAVTEILHYYLAAYQPAQKVAEGGGVPEETEDIELLEFVYGEILEKVRNGEIRDAKTLILIQYAALFGPLRPAAREIQ